MSGSTRQGLSVIDEATFCELLSGSGTVHVDITCIEEHFMPFVSFAADAEGARIACGVIVINRKDVLVTESMDELLHVLHDMAGSSTSLRINYPGEAGYFPCCSELIH